MTLRILGAEQVRRLLPMDRCIEAARAAMALTSSGRASQPIRTKMDVPGGKGLLSMMPGWIGDPERLGIKVITVFPGNFGTGVGSHQGVILLFDATHGSPLAVIDGREVTAIRTAAASAVATDALAREDAAVLGVYGYGEQAESHIAAIRVVRPIEKVLVWGRDTERGRAFAGEQAHRHGLPVEVRHAPQDLAQACDILCTTTAAAEPFFQGAWLRRGAHLNVVGSSIPTTAEIDVETLTRSRVFVDFRDSALMLGGDIRRAIAAGADPDTLIEAEVGQVLLGQAEGRRSADDITVFKSLGMVSEDLTAADLVWQAAQREDVGLSVDF